MLNRKVKNSQIPDLVNEFFEQMVDETIGLSIIFCFLKFVVQILGQFSFLLHSFVFWGGAAYFGGPYGYL